MRPPNNLARRAQFTSLLIAAITKPAFLIASLMLAAAPLALYVHADSEKIVPALASPARHSFLNVQPGGELKASYTGEANASFLEAQTIRPLSIATADFNHDGAPDLVTGYGTGAGGVVTLQRGNIDAFAPSSPAVYKAIHKGKMPASFLAEAQTFAVPQAPDFLLAGDFNLDGFNDVLVGSRGRDLYLVAGDGKGNFKKPRVIKLPGGVTAMAAGKFNQGGSVSDVAVAVLGLGATMLVFDDEAGGVLGTPASYPLTGEATSVVLDSLDEDFNYDVAAATGPQVEIIHGPGHSGNKKVAALAGGTSRIERIPLSFYARSLASAEFIWDRDSRHELAALGADGSLHILARSGLDERPYTQEEEAQRAWERENIEYTSAELEKLLSVPAWQSGRGAKWSNAGQVEGVKTNGELAPLVAGHLSQRPTADMVLVDGGARKINLLRSPGERLGVAKLAAQAPIDAQDTLGVDVEGTPLAVLAMPRKVNGSRDLIVLRENSPAPSAIVILAASDVTVDTTADDPTKSACTAGTPNDCSLRGAIQTFATNVANIPATIHVPAGTYNLTHSDGDILVDGDGTTLIGDGAATTIIDQELAGNQRIFFVNATPDANFDFSFSGLTLRDGHRTSNSGGAMLAGGKDNTTTITNCIFDNNSALIAPAALFGRGGAIIVLGGGTNPNEYDAGDLNITGSTFTDNTASNTGGAIQFDGGAVGTPTATITSCTFDNNESQNNDGGAMDLTSAGTLGVYTITKTTFTNNRALDNVAPDEQADHDGGAINKGNGVLNVSYSRFFQNSPNSGGQGDSALRVSGNNNVNIANNWWGCNGDPLTPAAGCDKVENAQAGGYTFTITPRLNLTHTASPTSVLLGGATTLTASFLVDSNGGAVSASNLDVLIGLPITFDNPSKGTLSNKQTTIQSNGTATATFTAGITSADCGNGGADATVDNQTVNAPVTVLCPDLTLAKANNVSNSAVVGQTWTWTLTVSNVGNAAANFTNGQTILTDNLPNSADISYTVSTPSIVLSAPNSGTVSCSINGTKDLICTANGAVTIGIPTGSFNVQITAKSNVVNLVPGYVNPRGGGIDRVDPNNVIVESNEGNNDAAGNTVTVDKAATTTTITNAASLNSTATVVGQAYTVQWGVTVNSPGSVGAALTGNVTVSDGAANCVAAVSAGQCNLTSTTAGAKTITATYAGDGNYLGDASPGDPHQVNKAATTTVVSNAASLNTTATVVGQAYTVQWNVTVNSPGSVGAALTGNVTVSDGTVNCVAAVSAGQCDLTSTTAGAKTITATYAGDINYFGDASPGDPHQVNKAATTTVVSNAASLNTTPTVVGQAYTVQWNVTVNSPGSVGAALTGDVTVSDGSQTCFAAVSAGQCDLTSTTAGAKTITATYAGDINYFGDASPGDPHQVNKADTTTLITSDNPDPSGQGELVTVNYTVTANGPGGGTPAGNVVVTVSGGAETCTGTVADGGCSLVLNTLGNPRTITAAYQGNINYVDSLDTDDHVVKAILNLVVNTLGDAPDSAVGDDHCDTDANLGNGDQCTLRAAIQETNSAPTSDIIGFSLSAGSTITLSSALDAINGNLVINGPGADSLTVERSNVAATDFRIFAINSGKTVSISGLTITKGVASGSAPANLGGGIYNDHGALTLMSVAISSNTAGNGGGIYSNGATSGSASLTILNSLISDNTSTNTAFGGGGGIYVDGTSASSTLTITNSTISGNKAARHTGGIYAFFSTTTLTNVTVTKNHADNNDDAQGAGGGIVPTSGTLTLHNTIVADNFRGSASTTHDDINGAVAAGSTNNLIGDGTGMSGILDGSGGNQVGTSGSPIDPLLDDLADNGGPTQTHALLPQSPALNAGNNAKVTNPPFAAPPFTDQRGTGFARIVFTTVDIGAFEVQVGTPDHLAFDVQPSNTAAGATITPAVTVQILDAGNGPTTSTASVTIDFGTNPSAGTLSGTTTVNAVNGTATFNDLSIDNIGNGYTFDAGSTGFSDTTSDPFNIQASTPDHLAFNVQPSNTAPGATITPAVTVRILDAGNNLTTSTANVTLAIGTNPSAGTLSGTTTVAAVNGTATFNNLSINNIGNGYTLTASSSGLTGATSNTFNIQAGPPHHLAFNVQPSDTAPGATITPAVTVRILDAGNNLTTSTADVALAIGTNPSAGTLSGTTTVAAVNGTATFNNLSIDNVGNGYTLDASSSGLTGATSNAFDIVSLPIVSGTKTKSGTLTPGSTVTYTVVLTNNGGAAQTNNPGNEFDDVLPSSLTLVSASATSGTTVATVGTNTVTWNGGIAGGGGSVTITITATINANFGASISNQGTINYDADGNGTNEASAVTDDPSVGGANNPTTFTVQGSPQISINDISLTEGDSGTTDFVFDVTLSAPSAVTVTVNFATANGTAVSPSDYQTTSGQVSFSPGDTSEPITVLVNGDLTNEPSQTFKVNLSAPVNATILDSQGIGTILNDDTPTGFQFSLPDYPVPEDDGSVLITVTRTGDPSTAASVDYATSDTFGLASCATINHKASERCDYLTALGTLKFAPSVLSRTFRVFITDDVRAEGDEVFNLKLSHPVNGVLNTQKTATATINDHVTAPGAPNPIDGVDFFVRQLYVDFLYREPDTIGFQNWTDTLNGCPNQGFGSDHPDCDRVHVATSFYGSEEFGQRGFFIYRFYHAGLGTRPTYLEFMRGMQRIGGNLNDMDSDAAKMEFITDFMQTPEFLALYGGLLIPSKASEFIQKLEDTSGVDIPEPLRSQLIADMANSTKSAAETLQAFMESQAVFEAYFNRGFVAMVYFGYLRRNPDTIGYNNWLTELDQTHDYRHLTFGFIYSQEYRLRFGPP